MGVIIIAMLIWVKLIILIVASLGITRLSWRALRQKQSHGFFRFFAWELILLLTLFNIDAWFVVPFSLHQLVSWPLLILSIYLVVEAVRLLKQSGQPTPQRQDTALLGLEKTSQLVTTGIYGFLRHPMYSSLLCFTLGVFFKRPSWTGAALFILAAIFLDATARAEEVENIAYFGQEYQDYMRQTKRFIPCIY